MEEYSWTFPKFPKNSWDAAAAVFQYPHSLNTSRGVEEEGRGPRVMASDGPMKFWGATTSSTEAPLPWLFTMAAQPRSGKLQPNGALAGGRDGVARGSRAATMWRTQCLVNKHLQLEVYKILQMSIMNVGLPIITTHYLFEHHFAALAPLLQIDMLLRHPGKLLSFEAAHGSSAESSLRSSLPAGFLRPLWC